MDNELFSLFDHFNERPIAYQRVYTELTGKISTGLLLSQLVYWAGAMKWSEFYKVDRELIDEVGMGSKEFKNAKESIKNLDFVSVELRGVPAKTYYKIDQRGLIMAILRLKHTVCPKGPNLLDRNGQTYITENTQKKDFSNEKSSHTLIGRVSTDVQSVENNTRQDLGDAELELVDESGEPLDPVGFGKKKQARPRKDKIALKIQKEFIARIKKEFGIDVPETSKGYFVVINAMNKFGMDEKTLMDVIDEWLSLGKPEEETVHITHCFSEYQLTNYKVRNQV